MIAQAPAKFKNNSRRRKNLVSGCPANTHRLNPRYSKCGLWNREFARNEDSRAPTQTYWKEAAFLIRSAGDSHAHYSLGGPDLKEVSLFTVWWVRSAGWYVLSEHIQDIDIEVSVCLGGWSSLISSEVSECRGRLLASLNQDPMTIGLEALGSIAELCSVLVLISNLIKPGSSAWQMVYPALAVHASQFIFIVLIKPQVIFQVQIVFSIIESLASLLML